MQKLSNDRNARVEIANADTEWMKENGEKLKEDEEQYVEDQFKAMEEEIEDEDERFFHSIKLKLQFQADMFKQKTKVEGEGEEAKEEEVPNEWRDRLEAVKQYKVIKYSRFIQCLFYFLGYEKEQVVEPGTQKLFWKTAKNLINQDFVDRMLSYQLMGAKSGEFTKYQKLNYIEKTIEGITEQ